MSKPFTQLSRANLPIIKEPVYRSDKTKLYGDSQLFCDSSNSHYNNL